MEKQLKHIPFEEFADNLAEIFNEVINEHETVVVESKYGELIEVKPITPASPRRRDKNQEDEAAFLSSAGAWADVDIDSFLKANEESRRLNTRPPIEL